MWKTAKVGVIIPAAGRGTRMGGARAKQFLDLRGKPVLIRTVERFQSSSEIDVIVLVAAHDTIKEVKDLVDIFHLTKVSDVVAGGRERQDSVRNGLETMARRNVDTVLVHDAVRPLVSRTIIRNVCASVEECRAAVPGVVPRDTIKQINGNNSIVATIDRSTVRLIQTPQGFSMELLLEAFEKATRERFYGTDEACLVERMGICVKLVDGSEENIKITTVEDLEYARMMFNETGVNA